VPGCVFPPSSVLEVFDDSQGLLMSNKLGLIVFIDGTVDQYVYMDILREELSPFLDVPKADGFANIVFQDNAKKTQNLLQ
jgi:hypothetical protein